MVGQAISVETIRVIGDDELGLWDTFVSHAANGHLLQSWGWGEVKRRHGWQPIRLAVLQNGQIQAGAQVLFRSIGWLSIAYIPRGPVVRSDDLESYQKLLVALHRLARRRRSVFLKLEPNEPQETALAGWLPRHGFLPSAHTVQPRATLLLNLAGGEDAVRARLPKKTRYQIRLAERRGVRVRAASDETGIRLFSALMAVTGERAGFAVRSLPYYRDVLQTFQARGNAEILLGELDGETIAGVMVLAFGQEGFYMYAASSSDHKEASPNDLLQWSAIQWCIERGCARYDLWGIPEAAVREPGDAASDEPADGDQGMWGVYRFKRRFADQAVRYVGAYDYPYQRLLYRLWTRLRRNREL